MLIDAEKRGGIISRFAIKHKKALWLIMLSHILWALCYPPFNLGPLAFIVLVPVFAATAKLSRAGAFGYNFIGGLFYNTIMYYWIYNVMKVGPSVTILMGLVLLIVYLSLFNGISGLLFSVCRKWRFGWLIYAVLWAGLEVLRTKGQMSFPWSHLGYALGEYTSLIQLASVVGIFGISIIMVAVNFLIYKTYTQSRLKPVLILGGVLALFLMYGIYNTGGSAPVSAKTADVSLVQPSVEQTKKWDEDYFEDVMNKTYSVMDKADLKHSDLIILAETAVPAFLRRRPLVQEKLQKRAVANKADIIVGSLDFTPNNHPAKPFNYFNSAFLIPKDTARPFQQYSKLRLVPFSERLPFDDFLPILNYVNLGEGDFSEGKSNLFWGDKFIYSPTICYEVVYPSFIREIKKGGAELLINITNDGWFGKSPAPFQHASICKFRAIETGLPIARCANSGISLFYDSKGRTLAKTRLFEKSVLRHKFILNPVDTIYLKIGDVFENLLFWIFVSFITFLVSRTCWRAIHH
ncbi:MAG: apolipoprotein N-acyltransferase [Fibrobacteria bacterium]|nr:apolipoprotein N-acyltransferase [Fibrobacteria bacterium]